MNSLKQRAGKTTECPMGDTIYRSHGQIPEMETSQAWAADVRRSWHIGDFTNWKDHDQYQVVFERFLHSQSPNRDLTIVRWVALSAREFADYNYSPKSQKVKQ